MKTIVLGLTALALGATTARAQTNRFEATQPPPQPGIVFTQPAPPGLTTVQKLFGTNATTGGVLPALKRRQLFSRAPAPHGQHFDNVSLNPATGRPEGILLFSIKF
jgi:hypothetical protein